MSEFHLPPVTSFGAASPLSSNGGLPPVTPASGRRKAPSPAFCSLLARMTAQYEKDVAEAISEAVRSLEDENRRLSAEVQQLRSGGYPSGASLPSMESPGRTAANFMRGRDVSTPSHPVAAHPAAGIAEKYLDSNHASSDAPAKRAAIPISPTGVVFPPLFSDVDMSPSVSTGVSTGGASPLKQRRGMTQPLLLESEDVDKEASVTSTWSINNQTVYHPLSGLKISSSTGMSFGGHEYKLSAEDVELDTMTQLGAGSCGVVLRGRIKQTGTVVAVKTYHVDDKLKREQLLNEIKGLVQAEGCPNLVQMYAGFVAQRANSVHVVLEFMDLGSLADLVKRLALKQVPGVPPSHLACVSAQVLQGLSDLHGRKVLHRDIKPGNILHNRQGEVKLTDFGIAKGLDTTAAMATTFVGSAPYMSPERCTGNNYSYAGDVWSVGVVLYELASGEYPYADISSFPKLFQHLCDGPEPRLENRQDSQRYPRDLCDLVSCTLTRDIDRRATVDNMLQHPFVKDGVGPQSRESLAKWLLWLESTQAPRRDYPEREGP